MNTPGFGGLKKKNRFLKKGFALFSKSSCLHSLDIENPYSVLIVILWYLISFYSNLVVFACSPWWYLEISGKDKYFCLPVVFLFDRLT